MTTKQTTTMVAVLVVATIAGAGEARADRRAFTHTYEYMTQPKGNLELELYNTQSSATYDTDSPTEIEQQVEVEYGITDHWDIALYQVFEGGEAAGASSLGYHETKIESRYRLAERGEWPVDVLLFLEVFKPFGIRAVGVEPKLVLARDFGPITVAANLMLELEPEEETDAATGKQEVEYETEPEFALGATWEIVPEWKLGAETWGNFEAFGDETTGGYGAYLGPAVSWAPSPKLWVSSTAGFKLAGTKDANDFVFSIGLGLSI
jgi:hypothetical protein